MHDRFCFKIGWFDARFEGVVQGKELDAILQKEVGPEEEEDLEAQATEDHIEEEQLDEDIEGDESDEDEAVSRTFSVKFYHQQPG